MLTSGIDSIVLTVKVDLKILGSTNYRKNNEVPFHVFSSSKKKIKIKSKLWVLTILKKEFDLYILFEICYHSSFKYVYLTTSKAWAF